MALSVLALLALGGTAALAGPGAVIDDYQADGRIDGIYNVQDLQDALDLMKGQAQYGAFRDLVGDAMVSAATGLRSHETGSAIESRSAAPPPPVADPQAAPSSNSRETPDRTQAELPVGLPTSPPTDPDSGLPVGFVVLSALAGALLLAGVSSTAYRRLRR